MTERLRCRYCHRPLSDTPMNRFHGAGWKCQMLHGTEVERVLLHRQWAAHQLLGLNPDRPVTADQLQEAASEWEALGRGNNTAHRYLAAAELVAELHGLRVSAGKQLALM